MIAGGMFSKEFLAKILNPLTSHWKRGSLLKSSSTDIGLTEKFVKDGNQWQRKHLKVIFNRIYNYSASRSQFRLP